MFAKRDAVGRFKEMDDVGRSLAADTGAHPERWTEQTPAPAWRRRWDELSPAYEAMEIE